MKTKRKKHEHDNGTPPCTWLNPKCEPLTVERLRQFPGMENLPDAEAEHIVRSIRIFAELVYEAAAVQERSGKVIPLPIDNSTNKAA